MNILICNVGSTSLKYQLFRMPEELVLASGGAERVGAGEGRFYAKTHENGALTEFEGTPDEYDKKRAVRDEDAERQRRERELGVDALRMRMAAIDARLNGKGISGDEREQLEGEYFAIAKQLREMQK